MTRRKSITPNIKALMAVGLIGLMAVLFIVFSVQQTTTGPGTTESSAANIAVLAPGDDVLSLENDLNTLSVDKTMEEEVHLNSVQ